MSVILFVDDPLSRTSKFHPSHSHSLRALILVALLYPFAVRALLTGLLLVEGGCRVVKSNRMLNPGMTGFPKENEQCLKSNRKHR